MERYLWTKFGAIVTNNNRFLKNSTALYSTNAEVEIYRAEDFATAWLQSGDRGKASGDHPGRWAPPPGTVVVSGDLPVMKLTSPKQKVTSDGRLQHAPVI